jgi:hypothetical protein
MRSDRENAGNPCWETMLSPCRGHDVWGRQRPKLRKALLTTFDPPDPILLIEDLLPVWLGLNRRDLGETNYDRYIFYTELHEALNRVRNRISVFHSYRPSSPASSWLWRQVRLFPVGRSQPAVQHAKIWMIHWSADEDGETTDWLEIIVSSCNLTRPAFRDQLQAAWRTMLPINDRSTRANASSWGVVPEFLKELGRSAGPDGETNTTEWIELLTRTECPSDADFVASIPGVHSASTLRRSTSAWGSAGLRNINLGDNGKFGVDILVPTVGTWNDAAWSRWIREAGLTGDAVSLAWVDRNHPWRKQWVLPRPSAQTFARHEISFRAVPAPAAQSDPWLHEHHVPQDPRWSHAKTYWFRRGRRRKVLVTSANLSPAAWGTPASGGGLRIENFELGVAVTCTERPIDGLPMLDKPNAVDAEPTDAEGVFAWSAASWDGCCLSVQCRLGTEGYRLDRVAKVRLLAKEDQELSAELSWDTRSLPMASIPWDNNSGVPISMRLSAVSASPDGEGEYQCDVPVADIRPEELAVLTPSPEIPEHERDAYELAILLERYSRIDAEDALENVAANGGDLVSQKGGPADYEVVIIEQSRRNWEVVDGWAAAYSRGVGVERECLLYDGRRLRDYWRRTAANSGADVAVAAELAADELDLRLEDEE